MSIEVEARSPDTRISVSEGFSDLLATLNSSIALTSYETGQLILVGRKAYGLLQFTHQSFDRAMGLAWRDGRLLLGTQTQLWRFEDLLEPGETGAGLFDALLVPRLAFTIGGVDVHEVGLGDQGTPLFVATAFNCIGVPDPKFSFHALWKPPFIASLEKGDRCHLNGIAMKDGRVVLATAVSNSDTIDSWREHRASGGVLMSVPDGKILVDGLAMPHSPRMREDGIYLLESGRGMLVHIDPVNGRKRDVTFLPGFARGLAIHGDWAVVTLSLPREISIAGLPLGQELTDRQVQPFCGLAFINLRTGNLDHWIRFEGRINQLFDVVWLEGLKCPTALGIGTEEIRRNIRVRPISFP